MKTEHSAGGVILRTYRNVWQILLIKDRSGKWTFPKGKMERGETALQTAIREINEEVALTNLLLKAPLGSVSYVYKRNGVVEKTVDYFLFQKMMPQKIVLQKEEGIHASRWVSISDAIHIIGYKETYTSILNNIEHLVQTF